MKKNKNFLQISLLIPTVLFPIFSYFVFNHKMMYMNQEYPMWHHIKHIINSNNEKIYDLVLIGDSRAKAGFIPNLCKTEHCINLAVGGGTPIEGYYTLKKFLKHNPTPKNLVLSYGPFHLDSQDCYWDRTVKFDFLNESEYREVENIASQIKDLNTLGTSKTYTDYLIASKYANDFKNGILERRWNQNIIVFSECNLSKGHYYFGREAKSDGLNVESKKENFREAPLLNIYFLKLIKLAKANGIRVYYYTMPFNKSSFDTTPKQYKNGYNHYISKMATDHNITVCNNLSFLTNDNFGDPSHLYRGSKIATNEILDCVKKANEPSGRGGEPHTRLMLPR